MANPILGDFVGFEFAPEEIEQARKFTDIQLFWLQNEKSKTASEKLRLVIDPINPNEFHLAHAYRHGMLDAFDYILSFAKGTDPKDVDGKPSNQSTQTQG